MNLAGSFEADLKESLLDDVEQRTRDEIGPELIRVARENWQAYATENDYDIEHIWEDVEGPTVDRSRDGVSLRIEWPGLTALFEFGVEPHTIEGNPLLHFYWEKIGQWVTTDEVNWGSETGGIPESRAIREAIRCLRTQLED